MQRQTPVVFTNRKGLRLFGMLHTPASGERKDVGILLLSPGVKMRVGPQCLYRYMTDAYVRQGFTVFRFDFHGIGDSEGELTETMLVDFYNHIEVGRYVEDAVDAIDWMQQHCGVSRVIASGLCGGAVTGLLAAERDHRVAGLIALGITPVLASQAANASQYVTTAQLDNLRRGYFRNLKNLESWWRLLTFRSDYGMIWKSLTKPFRRSRKPTAGKVGAAPSAPPERDNANPLFAPAFFNLLSTNRPILLVYSGADRLLGEFQEKFLARHEERLKDKSCYDVHVIANANHVLSLREWQQEMLDVSYRWLQQRFPTQRQRAAVASATH